MFSWTAWRRKRLMRRPLPPAWEQALGYLPLLHGLRADERRKLEGLMQVFVAEKSFEGCGGLDMREKIEVVIAAQACLLILHLHHDFYHRVRSILVYPTTFRHRMMHRQGDGTMAAVEGEHLGEAWPGGPVVLAWDSAYQGGRAGEDGQNTVIHEFAHKLDMLDGSTDGIPPLTADLDPAGWRADFDRAFDDHRTAMERGHPRLI
ncbi:MAG: zinc-dependent peptidase, partial [Planctomycetota bacterium]